MKPAIGLILIALLSACADEGTRLNADELTALLSEELSLDWEGYGFSGTADIRLDGSAHLTVSRLGNDTGSWWQEEDQICSQWKRVRDGEILCAYLGVFTDGRYELRSPKSNFQWGTFVVDQH